MARRTWRTIAGSNRIMAYDYDLPSYTLHVKFQPDKNNECDLFAYANVTPGMVINFLASPSKGRWLSQEIDAKKSDHPYQRMGKESAETTAA